ncbi:MAG TPA: hypothetical protein VJI68_00535 [Candidatus Nanoarchaeia archaeon]|nr:hypothetical protein [Candidatus Nanoarchaeia archaeon]
MKKLIVFLILMLVTLPFVFSQEVQEIPKGEDAKLTLPLFSKTTIRIYEGSKIDFNLVDSSNSRIILIKNTMIIDKVNVNNTEIRLSADGADFEDRIMQAGKSFNVTYNYSFLPYIEVKNLVSNIEPGKESVVLEFVVPFVNSRRIIGNSANKLPAVDPTLIKTTTESKTDFILFFLIAIIVVLIIVAGFLFYRKKK